MSNGNTINLSRSATGTQHLTLNYWIFNNKFSYQYTPSLPENRFVLCISVHALYQSQAIHFRLQSHAVFQLLVDFFFVSIRFVYILPHFTISKHIN